MSSSQQYAAEGFDPSSLKMAQLRSILLQHGVAPSSTARKADLVAEFNRHVAPKAAALRSRDASIVASGSGIIDMRAQPTDKSSLEATPAKPLRKGRKSTAPPQAEPEVELVVPTPAGPSSSAQPEEGEEVPVKRKRGRPRKSAPASVAASQPLAKEVSFEVEETPKLGRTPSKSKDESAFSDYNPFQSGSEASPEIGPAAKAAAAAARRARRKTTDGRSSKLVAAAARSSDDEHTHEHEEAMPPKASASKAALPQSMTLPTFKNYMDASVAASTPPRIIGKAIRKGREMLSPARSLGAEDERRDEEGLAADNEDDEEDDKFGPSALSPGASPTARAKGRSSKRYAHEDLSTSQKLSQLLWTCLILGLVAYGVWYARESRAVGYCDTGSTTNSILIERQSQAQAAADAAGGQQNGENDEDDDALWAGQIVPASIRPACAPCPSHAECKGGKLLGCTSQDYVLQTSLLDMVPLSQSIFPLAWTKHSCVPDTQKLVLASELASAVNHFVAKWKGDVVCGYEGPHSSVAALVKRDHRPELRYALPESTIREAMSESRDAELIPEELFEQLWDLAMDDVSAPGSNVLRLAVNASSEDAGTGSHFLAAKAPILSIGCRSRLAFRAWLKRTRIYFFLVASAVIAITLLRRRWRLAREEKKKVAELVQVALERLQEQEYAHAVDPVINPDSYVPTSHLRDHVLRSEHSTSARQRLWKKVGKVVEENSNVRTRQANRRGEWLRVWEWVGVVGAGMSQMRTPQSASKIRASPEKRGSAGQSRLAKTTTAEEEEEEMRQLAY